MELKEFTIIYKNLMWGLEHGVKLSDDETNIIHDAFLELCHEDQQTVAKIFLNDIKECFDNPLSLADMSKLKYLNSKEIIKLKSWVVKLAASTVAIIILLFTLLLVIDLFPGVMEGVLNITDWDIDIWHSLENGLPEDTENEK